MEEELDSKRQQENLQKFALDSEKHMYPIDPEIVKDYIKIFWLHENADVDENVQYLQYNMNDFIRSERFGVHLAGPDFEYPSVDFIPPGASLLHSMLSPLDNALRQLFRKLDEQKLKLAKVKIENNPDLIQDQLMNIQNNLADLAQYHRIYIFRNERKQIFGLLTHFLETIVPTWTAEEKIQNMILIEFGRSILTYIYVPIRKSRNVKAFFADLNATAHDVKMEMDRNLLEYSKPKQEIDIKPLKIEKVLNLATLLLRVQWAILHGSQTLGPLSSIW